MFLVFLAAQQNTIPSSPVVGRVERESCFGVFGKYDSRLFGSWDGLSGNRVFGVFLAAENLKNTIPSSPVVGRVERESCFWCL